MQVTVRLQRLLQPSYYPGPEGGPALVAALLRQQPSAGTTFCAALAGALPGSAGVLLLLAVMKSATSLSCFRHDRWSLPGTISEARDARIMQGTDCNWCCWCANDAASQADHSMTLLVI